MIDGHESWTIRDLARNSRPSRSLHDYVVLEDGKPQNESTHLDPEAVTVFERCVFAASGNVLSCLNFNCAENGILNHFPDRIRNERGRY